MEELELEEGEACSYNITNDYGGSEDPDIDLSYIDEKLQNILGHFQKDFEGGVSAENLGAKYGGYGSFLPTYQRSPVGSHPRTPAKPQSSAGIRSPNNLQGESQSVNAASPIVPRMAKSGPASSGKPKKSMKSKKLNYTENSNSRHASATKKPGVFSKQNSLKLRIKMGSDNISADKNAAIYSGLGLDASPSLSLDNSLSGSEGMNGEPHYSPLESPASILMIMTSLPVDGQLLSPLSDDLIRFIEGEKTEKEYKCISPSRLVTESSSAIGSGFEPKKVEVMPSVEKKRKIAERNSLSAGTNVRSKKLLLDGTEATVKEPTTSYPTAVVKETATKLIDASKESCNGTVRGELVGDGERRLWGLTHQKDLEPLENPKTSSAGSVREDKKARSSDNASGSSRKAGKYKGSKSSGSVKKESSASKKKSGHKTESELYSRKQKSDQIDTSDEQDGTKFFKEQEPQSSSGGKTKFKEQRSTVVTETKMNGQADFHSKKKEVVALQPQNDGKKVEDTYKDFFGDMGDSEEEEQPCSLEVKDLRISEKGLPPLEDMPEKSSFPLTDSENVGPPISTKFNSDASLPKSNPVIIQEHWVACDKCGKWRLLPFGVFPEDLPEKWMCTMLNWLPGVNYCNVPEDETTKALYAMYQIPVPESQAPMQNNLSGPKTQFNQADDSIKKKKKGFKKIDNGMDKEGVRTAENNKKTMQASARNGGIHNAHANTSQSDFGRLSDLTDERQKQKQKGKAVDHHSDGGELKSLKMNSKRHADRESSVLTKKMKIENFLFPEEDQGSEHGCIGNGRHSSSSGVPAGPADNDRRKFTNPLKESQSDKKHKPQVSSKLPKEEGASDTGNSDITGANKKRKLRESHSSQVYKEFSENENHERKKARVLNQGREPSLSQGNGKSEKKNRSHSKREHGHVHNSVTATSSSSKISDSHKAKNNSLEAKCSPVESVSSSPMRTFNPEKSASARKEKEEFYDANVFAAGSLRRYSDGEEDGGSDRSQAQMKDKHGFHETSVLDMWDKESLKAEPSLDTKRYDFENGGHKDLPRKLDRIQGEGKQPSDHRHSNGSVLKKSGKSSSSRSKDKDLSMRSDSQDGSRHTEKKMYDGKLSRGSKNPESQTDVGPHCSPDTRVGMARPNIPKPHDGERVSERSNRADIAFDRDASQSRPPSRGVQNEAIWDSSTLSARKKAEKCGTSAGNSIQADDVTKATTQIRKRSEPSPSPLRKELTSAQAAHATLKEAKDLKHTADRLKNDVSNIEHIELYFQACLKFLHGAFLLEMSSNESARQGETMVQSMKIYISTANLCGFCAHEYEKSKDMGAAALAYKCMEAAYMRVVNSSYTSANRYRNELQTSLQMVPPGESPSSSASDVDNVNHPAAADRVGISKGINSPLVAGNHVISAQNRSNILRLLQFSQDVNLAMDASRKSRVALASSIENLGEAQQQGEGIVSIKSALDFNFHDVEGLLRLVKLAMKANNR